MKDLFAKVRPQILLLIVGLTGIAIYSISVDSFEVVTGCVTGLTGIGVQILQDKD